MSSIGSVVHLVCMRGVCSLRCGQLQLFVLVSMCQMWIVLNVESTRLSSSKPVMHFAMHEG